jgi:hypothetical protein
MLLKTQRNRIELLYVKLVFPARGIKIGSMTTAVIYLRGHRNSYMHIHGAKGLGFFLYLFAAAILIIQGCSSVWTKTDIEKKLKKVFPDAVSVRVVDADEMKAEPDTFGFPPPVYKATVVEKDIPGESFLFYFFQGSGFDSTEFKKIFNVSMKSVLSAGLGSKPPRYVFSMPQYTNPGNLLLVSGTALHVPDTYDVKAKEKKFIEVFGLASGRAEKK